MSYGFLSWRDFFTDRQLLALALLRGAILDIADESARGPLSCSYSFSVSRDMSSGITSPTHQTGMDRPRNAHRCGSAKRVRRRMCPANRCPRTHWCNVCTGMPSSRAVRLTFPSRTSMRFVQLERTIRHRWELFNLNNLRVGRVAAEGLTITPASPRSRTAKPPGLPFGAPGCPR
jgi:hypothetical protein